jgi:hypothetical protein
MPTAIGQLLIVVLLATAPAVHAGVEIWKFNGVTFNDGGIADGQFSVDTDLKLITDFSIFTGVGTLLTSSFQYNSATAQITGQAIEVASGEGFFVQLDSSADVIPNLTRELRLSFSGPLVPTGSASIVSDGTLGRTSSERQVGGEMGPQRVVVGTGNLHPAPEPAEVLFLSVGLAITGIAAVRRVRAQLS